MELGCHPSCWTKAAQANCARAGYPEVERVVRPVVREHAELLPNFRLKVRPAQPQAAVLCCRLIHSCFGSFALTEGSTGLG